MVSGFGQKDMFFLNINSVECNRTKAREACFGSSEQEMSRVWVSKDSKTLIIFIC